MSNQSRSWHAAERLRARYGFYIDPDRILALIRQGKARRCLSPLPTRLIWDVPYNDAAGQEITVRVVADVTLTRLITALPPEFVGEKAKRAEKQRKKQFFRAFKSDEDAVTDEA